MLQESVRFALVHPQPFSGTVREIWRGSKANDRMLGVILLALIAVVCVALWYADKVEREGKAAAAAEQPADEAAEAAAATLAGEGTEAPDFTVEMIDGSKVALSELRGKVVLLNFWATWCPPCREELSHVQQQVIDRFAGEEFVFLPISRGEERAAVEAFRAKTGYAFPMGLDTDETIYKRYATRFIPRNFLIDRTGRVVKATVGYDDEEFAELLRAADAEIQQK